MNMSKSWRPDGWTYGDGYAKPQRVGLRGRGRLKAFEAGADAMLEALRNQGDRETDIHTGRVGMKVFIPNDHLVHKLTYKKCDLERELYPHLKLRNANTFVTHIHPAAEIIEKGYFCTICGLKFPYSPIRPDEECTCDAPAWQNRGISY